MNSKAVRYIVYGQVCFYVGLLVCIIIRPAGLANNAGISYYGVYRETILPYILALLGSAYFTIKAAEHFSALGQVIMRYALTLMGLLTIGILITPDSLSKFMDGLHRGCGASLFSIQLLLSVWLVVQLRYKLWAIIGTLVELGGGIASFHYLSLQHGLLLQAQVVFQAGFGWVIIYSLPRLMLSSSLAEETPEP